MRVVLNVTGHVCEYFPGKASRVEVDLPGPMSLADILRFIGVSPELVMYSFSKGTRHGKDYVPGDGEEILLIAPPAGG